MNYFVDAISSFFSGVYNYVASCFVKDRISAVAKPAIDLQAASENDLSAAQYAAHQLKPALESQRSLTRLFYAIIGRETPAMRELCDRLAAIELSHIEMFRSVHNPAESPTEFIADKREYVQRLKSQLKHLEDQGLTEGYIELLKGSIPKDSAAFVEYRRIKSHLNQLKSTIEYSRVGSDIEEIAKFGRSVEVPAIKCLMIKYLTERERGLAYELLVSHIENRELLSPKDLNKVKKGGSDHAPNRLLILQALTRVMRSQEVSFIKNDYITIINTFKYLFNS